MAENVGDWPRIREVLEAALDRDEQERESFVEGACDDSGIKSRVLSMLRAYETETEAFPVAVRPVIATETYDLGTSLGPYRLEKHLGAGGMGAVFLARRSDEAFDKQVAIKLLRRPWASDEEVSRFRRERQILADLVHPSIAQLLDGGNTPEGRPYLVMEYVKGRPVDRYCREKGASLDQRLDIFLQVCSAVQFAHQRLIVHRDLKPGNILVSDEGRVKLLDFGIAKILDAADFSMTVHETRPGGSPMTLAFASPEQLRGEAITTATDVYALGLLLYLLLTDRKPYTFDGRDLPAAVDAICRQEVTAPSEVVRRIAAEDRPGLPPWRKLRGDLDAVVQKCLAKEPERRYASVDQLAEDLRRFRASLPIRARRGNLLYRTRKFLYRRRGLLTAAAAIFLVLVTSIGVLLRQQDLLIRQRNQAETVSRWMIDLFELPDPDVTLGAQVTARELLDKSSETIREDLESEPELLARMLTVLGTTYFNLGLYPEAREMIDDALELPTDAEKTVDLKILAARIASRMGRFLESFHYADEAQRTALEELPEPERSPERAAGLHLRGHAATDLGRYAEAEESLVAAVTVARRSEDPKILAEALDSLASLRRLQGRHRAAEGLIREALALRRPLYPPSHSKILRLEELLIVLRAEQEDADASYQAFGQVVEKRRRLFDPGSPRLASSLAKLGDLAKEAGRFEAGREHYEEAIRIIEEALGDRHPQLLPYLNNYGLLELDRNRLEAAEALLRRALGIAREQQGASSFAYAGTLNQLAYIDAVRGRFAEAEEKYRRALDIFEQSLGPTHSRAVMVRNNLGDLEKRRGRMKEARGWLEEAVRQGRRAPERPEEFSAILYNLAGVRAADGDLEAAVELMDEVLHHEGPESVLGLEARTWKSRHLLDLGDAAAAEREAGLAALGWSELGGHEAWRSSAARIRALAVLAGGRPAEAIEQLERVLADRRTAGAADAKIVEVEEDLRRARSALRAKKEGTLADARAETDP